MPRIPALLAGLGLLSAAASAHAQILSIYGTFSPTHLSDIRNGNNTGTSGGYTTTSFWTPNVGGGVTFGVLPVGPIHIGLDVRGSSKPGTNGSDTVLVGLRAGLKLPILKVKPYVQASGGYLRTRVALSASPSAGQTSSDGFAAYEILGGVDYKFLPFFDLRLIEIGGGQGYHISGTNNGDGSYNPSLLTINTGVVFHF